jgi:AAA domain-containing protein
LSIQDVPVASVQPRTWAECRDLAAALGGPCPELPPTSAYSQAHYDSVMTNPDIAALTRFDMLFIDTLTAAARLSLAYAETLPEALNDRGRKDTWAIYGAHARQMLGWLHQLQQARDRHVVFTVALEKQVDRVFNISWELQIEGSKTGKELPGIVDEVITMSFVDFGDSRPVRAFICTSPNQWSFPAKDRSGKLDQIEEPHLGNLITKLTAKPGATVSPAA